MLAQNMQVVESDNYFTPATDVFGCLVESLNTPGSYLLTSSELEKFIKEQTEKLARELLQAKLNMIGRLEVETVVKGSDGVARPRKRLVERTIGTIFGDVTFERWGYSAEKGASLFPADGHLNLPPEKYSHELRRLVSEDVTRSSYDEALEVLSRRTAATVPKRQGLELVHRAAEDFVGFYDAQVSMPEDQCVTPKESGSLLILTTDGKGVVMRHEGLRKATKKAAEKKQHKLEKRLTAGEKKDRKRMAQVASVYTIAPHIRTAEEIAVSAPVDAEKKKNVPRPEDKRVWASLEREPDQVIEEMFKEAQTRDPRHKKQWVALVDGNKTQLKLIKEQAMAFGASLTIIIDFIHVLEYLWKASHVFYKEGDSRCEKLVTEHLLLLLHGQSSQVAKELIKMTTDLGLKKDEHKGVDKCVSYLTKYKEYLCYDKYLAQGLPIATGVIEGACRYLVKDRMDITGARWGLPGGEAVLRLRSLWASDDFDEYWSYHVKREQERNHSFKYENGQIPPLKVHDAKAVSPKSRPQLRLVKR